jgi:hypothetical protein
MLADLHLQSAGICRERGGSVKEVYRHHALLEAKANLATYRAMYGLPHGPLPAPKIKQPAN